MPARGAVPPTVTTLSIAHQTRQQSVARLAHAIDKLITYPDKNHDKHFKIALAERRIATFTDLMNLSEDVINNMTYTDPGSPIVNQVPVLAVTRQA